MAAPDCSTLTERFRRALITQGVPAEDADVAASWAQEGCLAIDPTAFSLADCAELWKDLRGALVADGYRDGEARRAADETRAACEAPELERRRIEATAPSPTVGCADDPTLTPPSDLARSPTPSGVYFICVTVTPPGEIPVARLPIEATGQSTEALLDAVLRAYFTARSDEDARRGYGFLPPDGAALYLGVDLVDGHAVLELSATLETAADLEHSGQIDAFLTELRANVFQLETIHTLEIRIEGDCRRFWANTPYGPTCLLLHPDGALTEGRT